jgi:transcription antitermination factor NusG
MEKRWYALYTRQNAEKKISGMLNGKGIENFYPVNNNSIAKNLSRKKLVTPLFSTYLFAYMDDQDVAQVSRINGLRFIYWMSQPVVIEEQEIDLIKNLSANYINIKLEKIPVSIGEQAAIVDAKGSSVPFSYTTLCVKLPTLGYIATGERRPVFQEEEVLTPAPAQFNLFSRRLSSLFT